MKSFRMILLLPLVLLLTSCGSFKAERVSAKESDEKALEITDAWVSEDTRKAIADTLNQIQNHPKFKQLKSKYRGGIKLFIAEVQNNTADAYFPIADLNDEFLFEISKFGEFQLVDNQAREKILSEITYQNDGMVDPETAKRIGKQVGADVMIFGSVYMKPQRRSGKTIKEYSFNLRLTDIEKGLEILRTRVKSFKYSDQNSYGL